MSVLEEKLSPTMRGIIQAVRSGLTAVEIDDRCNCTAPWQRSPLSALRLIGNILFRELPQVACGVLLLLLHDMPDQSTGA